MLLSGLQTELHDVDPTHEQVLMKVLKPKMVTCNENGRRKRGGGRLFLFSI